MLVVYCTQEDVSLYPDTLFEFQIYHLFIFITHFNMLRGRMVMKAENTNLEHTITYVKKILQM